MKVVREAYSDYPYISLFQPPQDSTIRLKISRMIAKLHELMLLVSIASVTNKPPYSELFSAVFYWIAALTKVLQEIRQKEIIDDQDKYIIISIERDLSFLEHYITVDILSSRNPKAFELLMKMPVAVYKTVTQRQPKE